MAELVTPLFQPPLSLQDTCKLNILFFIEDFPVALLAKLPLSIRNALFKALSVCDCLHYNNTAFLEGLDPFQEGSRVYSRSSSAFSMQEKEVDVKNQLINLLFAAPDLHFLADCCKLNIEEAFGMFDCLPCSPEENRNLLIDSIFDHISTFDSTKVKFVCIKQPYSDQPGRLVLLPSRFSEHLICEQVDSNYEVKDLRETQKLLAYCGIQKGPRKLVIDSCEFRHSELFKEYLLMREKALSGSHVSYSDIENVPVISPTFPFLEKILASVVDLKIGTDADLQWADYNEYDCFVDAPYLILHNIASSGKAALKSVEIYGICTAAVRTLETVGGFLIGEGYSQECYHVYDEYHYRLPSPPNDPLLIDILVVNALEGSKGYVSEYMTAYQADSISRTVQQIVNKQMQNLKSVELSGLGFTYESLDTSSDERMDAYRDKRDGDEPIVNCETYCTLLSSTFVEFVKQPQFCSLKVSDSPEKGSYELIATFLATPASHEQSLSIALREDIPNLYEPLPLPEALPKSNGNFKLLDLGTNKSRLAKFLIGSPQISLKSLSFSDSHLSTGSPDAVVNIEVVSLHVDEPSKSHMAGLNSDSLDLFISKNASLKVLEIFPYRFSRNPLLFPTLNVCLKKELDTKRSIKEIAIYEIDFKNHTGGNGLETSAGYSFVRWSGYKTERKIKTTNREGAVDLSFFTSLDKDQPLATEKISVPDDVSDKDIYTFLVLVQKLGVSLTLSGFYGLFSHYQETNLFPSLAKSFGDKKIKKIILKGEPYCKESLKNIAETVVTQ